MIKNIIFDFGDIFINLGQTGEFFKALENKNIQEFLPKYQFHK